MPIMTIDKTAEDRGEVGGEFGFTETLKHFCCSQNSRNSGRLEGLQLQPSFFVQV